jgi:predicted cupin superfamily sugar epimerase
MNASDWIDRLALTPHPEGGYFRRTFGSTGMCAGEGGSARHLMTSIYYLLTQDAPLGRLHRNRSDILHFFHAGAPLTYWLLFPDGRLERHEMGPDPARGQVLQLAVPGGTWKASQLESGAYGLISEAVAPGFDAADREMACASKIRQAFPAHWARLSSLMTGADG